MKNLTQRRKGAKTQGIGHWPDFPMRRWSAPVPERSDVVQQRRFANFEPLEFFSLPRPRRPHSAMIGNSAHIQKLNSVFPLRSLRLCALALKK
jgi:hypothetical protein